MIGSSESCPQGDIDLLFAHLIGERVRNEQQRRFADAGSLKTSQYGVVRDLISEILGTWERAGARRQCRAPDEARRHTSGGGIAIIARRSLFTPIKLAHTLLPGQARDGGPGRVP